MTRIEIKADDKHLQQALAALVRLGQDLTPVMAVIGSYVENATKERFDTGVGPDGIPWRPSRRAAATGGKTLVDRGHLRDSITYFAIADEVMIGSNVIYAAIHQFGGVIKPKTAKKLKFRTPGGGFAVLDQVTMPARPMFGVNAKDETEISAIIEDFYQEAVHAN